MKNEDVWLKYKLPDLSGLVAAYCTTSAPKCVEIKKPFASELGRDDLA
jgi:hypothetical protein